MQIDDILANQIQHTMRQPAKHTYKGGTRGWDFYHNNNHYQVFRHPGQHRDTVQVNIVTQRVKIHTDTTTICTYELDKQVPASSN